MPPTGPAARPGGPLAGIRVVELGRYVAAPLAGRLLADWGADVIKVEAPAGDPMRWGPLGPRSGYSPQFASYNRGKRSLTLDLKADAGQCALKELVLGADVLLHNLRASALTRLGVDVAEIRATHPDLIVCGVSGFGDVGPHATGPGFDAIISGMSGLYSQVFDADASQPTGPAFSDVLAGMFTAQAVLAALVTRLRGSGGQDCTVNMLECAATVIDDAFTTYGEAGVETAPDARQARQHIFSCTAQDDVSFVVQLSSSRSAWAQFALILGHREWLDDSRFVDYPSRLRNFAALCDLVRRAARFKVRQVWIDALRAADIAAGPINSIAEACVDRQVQAAELLIEVPVGDEAPMTMTRPVGRFSATPLAHPSCAPPAGEHTLEILDQLRLDAGLRAAVEQSWRERRSSR